MRTAMAMIVALGCAACASSAPPPPAAHPAIGAWGFDLAGLDPGVKPGDDFYAYVNGKWLASATIPPDRGSTGSFDDLQILSERRLKDLVAELAAKPYAALDGEGKQLRDLYDAFTDTGRIDAAGLAPAEHDLAAFRGVKTHDDVARVIATHGRVTSNFFYDVIAPDPKHPDAYIVTLGQSGLGMPDRDYYLRDAPALAATRQAYRAHLATMLSLAGRDRAPSRAAAVYALETKMAQAEWSAAERRDADKTYNPVTITALARLAPGFPWAAFFKAEGISRAGPNGERVVVVREKSAFPRLSRLFASTPVDVWCDYLIVHYLDRMSSFLPAAIDEANFAFYGKTLGGEQQRLDRATRAVRLLDARLGQPLGKLYVAKYFPPEAKAKVEALVANLLKVYDADIRTLPWMTEATREKALDKLHKFTPHVGYPDHWRDYSGLVIRRDDLIGDIERSNLFEWQYHLDRLDRPVDRDEWNMTSPTVNAYYSAEFNSIFFPAAILQPPFFDPNADDAVNYGGIGAVIGHEISHGFDDQGSKYDGDGRLQTWWTEDDRAAFDARTAALAAQYDAYEGLPGLHVNGKLTLGENIADLSGLSIALKAYHIALGGRDPPVLDGFTGDQRFFLAFGQIWRVKMRDAALRRQILSNPHSPSRFRTDGATRNVDNWYDAFSVKPGDAYYLAPADRVHLW